LASCFTIGKNIELSGTNHISLSLGIAVRNVAKRSNDVYCHMMVHATEYLADDYSVIKAVGKWQ